MAYQMAATAVTLDDFEGHSQVAGLFQMQSSKIYWIAFNVERDIALFC